MKKEVLSKMTRKWFQDILTVEELRKKYKELLKQYHPDNVNGNVEIAKEINVEYDFVFAHLSQDKALDEQSSAYDKEEENEAFKEVLNSIIHINADVEIIGCWIWVLNGYEYKELLKTVGFRFAPKKKCWCWHYGEYRKYHNKEVSLDEIREKYGSQKVKNKAEQRRVGNYV